VIRNSPTIRNNRLARVCRFVTDRQARSFLSDVTSIFWIDHDSPWLGRLIFPGTGRRALTAVIFIEHFPDLGAPRAGGAGAFC
jgi:hypothetical protein